VRNITWIVRRHNKGGSLFTHLDGISRAFILIQATFCSQHRNSFIGA
jgi:hypothetical protein